MESKKRWSNGFLGSIIFHTLMFAFVGIFASFSPDRVSAKDEFIEVDYFSGTGGGGGGGGGGDKPITHSILEDRVHGAGGDGAANAADKSQNIEKDAIVDKGKTADNTAKPVGGHKEESKAIYPGADKGPNTGTGGGYGSGTGTGIGSGVGPGSGSGSGGGHGSGTGTGIGSGSGPGTGGKVDTVVAVNARLVSHGSLVYPDSARTLEAGRRTATIKIYVDEKGKVVDVQLVSSTGSSDLDNAAVRYGYTHKFTPARNAQGVGLKVSFNKSITFELKG